LEEIPESIGHLQQLESLNLAHNDLCSLPKTISYLTRLEDLNLSYNQLETITPHIGHLEKLQTLCVSNNHLIELTVGIKGLINLSVLDISNNKVTTLPAEITQLPFLRRLRLDGCPLTNSLDHYSVRHDPPSLLETCARLIVKNDIYPVSEQASLTEPLEDYLRSYNLCSHCNAPYFESFVSRGRWIEKNDIWIPLEYRLCSAHWSDESDRMYAMFSSNPKNPPLLSKRPDAAIYDTTLTKQNKSRKSRYQLLSSNGTIEDQEEEEAASMSKQWRIKVTNRPSFWRKARLVQR
jgi:hypothetical protein